ncbi:MAG: isochorismatase family cysteine hydrolase [Woeseiaceae bacterium]|nr:isochorismatase family cysteine hydrolase [Woeseiaceae bacterium]
MATNCLIIIDMQNDFLDRLEDEGLASLLRNLNQLIDMFRASGCPVIWVRTLFEPDLSDAFLEMKDRQIAVAIRGTPGGAIHSDLRPLDDDRFIDKKRYSAFFGTDLDRVLDELRPDEITLAGVNTHACVRMTAIDAYQRDRRVLLASECIDSLDAEHARISMAYMHNKIGLAMTNAEIAKAIA